MDALHREVCKRSKRPRAPARDPFVTFRDVKSVALAALGARSAPPSPTAAAVRRPSARRGSPKSWFCCAEPTQRTSWPRSTSRRAGI